MYNNMSETNMVYVTAEQCSIVDDEQTCLINVHAEPYIVKPTNINSKKPWLFYEDEWTTTEKATSILAHLVLVPVFTAMVAPFSIPIIIAAPFIITYRLINGIPPISGPEPRMAVLRPLYQEANYGQFRYV